MSQFCTGKISSNDGAITKITFKESLIDFRRMFLSFIKEDRVPFALFLIVFHCSFKFKFSSMLIPGCLVFSTLLITSLWSEIDSLNEVEEFVLYSFKETSN